MNKLLFALIAIGLSSCGTLSQSASLSAKAIGMGSYIVFQAGSQPISSVRIQVSRTDVNTRSVDVRTVKCATWEGEPCNLESVPPESTLVFSTEFEIKRVAVWYLEPSQKFVLESTVK